MASTAVQLSRPTALIIIDLQKAIDDPIWSAEGTRNNPQAEENTSRMLSAWRELSWPIYHVRHDSHSLTSPYRPGQSGNDLKLEIRLSDDEKIVVKGTNSAFIGTDLEAQLRGNGATATVMAGVITNNSVEATVRIAGNLGFNVYLPEDASFTFARRDYFGVLRTAAEVHAMSLANMNAEYCTVVRTQDILEAARRFLAHEHAAPVPSLGQ